MLHALQRISKHQFYCLWFNPDQGSNPQYTTIKTRTLTILSSMKIFDNGLTTTNEDKPLTWSVSSSLKLPAHLHMHASLSLYHSPDNIQAVFSLVQASLQFLRRHFYSYSQTHGFIKKMSSSGGHLGFQIHKKIKTLKGIVQWQLMRINHLNVLIRSYFKTLSYGGGHLGFSNPPTS